MQAPTVAPGKMSLLFRGMVNARFFQTLMLIGSLYFGVSASWIHVKAELAQLLINHAWQKSLDTTEQQVKPWAWADTEPVARLKLPNNKILVVLNGSQGNSLAFGPGLAEGSDKPGHGFSVIGGHRDTHFSDLENVKLGQKLGVQNTEGKWIEYLVTEARVINTHEVPLKKEAAEKILLVTCYPFNTLNSDPDKRWVVTGERLTF